MAIVTELTELMGVEHPIVSAPMGGSAGGALAAAVSNGGGLGLVGGGRGERDWLERELDLVRAGTERPWGVGLLSWAVRPEDVAHVLEWAPHAVMLSFGPLAALARPVKQAAVRLLVQVTDLEEAERALEAGADVLIAQGSEAGGHGGSRATLPFVPAVLDLAGGVPVLAAGGIADGRGVAAVLALGAAGALIGTLFQTSPEALVEPSIAKAILAGRGEDTERNRLLDIARGSPWPPRYTGRALRSAFLDQWRGREQELAARPDVLRDYQAGLSRGDPECTPVWAGEAIDLVTEPTPAAELVRALIDEAERALAAIRVRPGTRLPAD